MAAPSAAPSPDTGDRPSGQPGPAPASSGRLYWRAVVRSGGHVAASRERDRVEWHLSDCAAPSGEGSHCTEGLHLLETVGQPDGHCLVNGVCGRCGATQPQPEPEPGPQP